MATPRKKKASKRPTPKKPQRRDGKRRAHGSKFIEETKVKILTKIRNGLERVHAAEACGIDERTLQRWIARGRDEQAAYHRAEEAGEAPEHFGEYHSFLLDVIENEALATSEDADVVRRASLSGDVGAAQWRLSRLRRSTYGDQTKITIGGVDDSPDPVGRFLDLIGQIAERLGVDPPTLEGHELEGEGDDEGDE